MPFQQQQFSTFSLGDAMRGAYAGLQLKAAKQAMAQDEQKAALRNRLGAMLSGAQGQPVPGQAQPVGQVPAQGQGQQPSSYLDRLWRASQEATRMGDMETAKALGSQFNEAYDRMFKADPRGAVDFLNRTTGQNLTYHGDSQGLHYFGTDKTGYHVYDPTTQKTMQIKAPVNTGPEWDAPLWDPKMQALTQRNLTTGKVERIGAPPKGMRIESDGKGGFTFIEGVGAESAPGITKPTANQAEQDIYNAGAGLQRLARIEQLFKPEYQQLGTRWSNLVSATKDKLGMDLDPQEKAGLEEFAAYKRDALDNLNRYIKEITGAQMSAQEAERITRGLPNPGTGLMDGDSPTEFKSKIGETMRALRYSAARASYVRRVGLTYEDIPLERMGAIINRRGQELSDQVKQQNPEATPEQVKAQVRGALQNEFGLSF